MGAPAPNRKVLTLCSNHKHLLILHSHLFHSSTTQKMETTEYGSNSTEPLKGHKSKTNTIFTSMSL